MADRPNIPVLVGVVPLLAVTSFVVNEGYKTASIAGSTLTQMVAPTTKTISIEALLVAEFRALRPALEAMAATRSLERPSLMLITHSSTPAARVSESTALNQVRTKSVLASRRCRSIRRRSGRGRRM